MVGDTSVDMMLNVLPGTMTGIFALNAGLSSINQVFQNMTKSVDNHFGILEASIVSATALFSQISIEAAGAFGEYEQGMKIVQAVSGQTSAQVEELGQQINHFSVQYRMDIDELTTGLQTLGRAGLKSAQEQTEVLENGLQTAKLEGRDLNSILEEIIQNTTLLGGDLKSSNFGEQTEYVNDLLVATSMTAPINTHDISETLKYSGGMLAAGGGTIVDESGQVNEEGREIIEDYMGTVASFAQKGVTGSIAGTALRAFFNKPATQDTSVTEALATIHLKPEYLWEEGEEQMKPVSEQIGLIQSQMDKLNVSQMDRLQIWSKIVGGKMGQQMIKLNSSDIKEVTKDIREANSAENLATQSMQTYQSAIKQTSEAGQEAFRAYGEHVARFGTIGAKILTPILDAMANPVVSTGIFITFIALIGRAAQAAGRIISGLRNEIAMIKASLQSFVLNQPTRKVLVGNNLWGGKGLWGEQQAMNQISAKASEVQMKTRDTATTSMVASNEIVTKLTSIEGIVERFRRTVTYVNNRIMEMIEETDMSILGNLSKHSQKINQSIANTGTKANSEFNNVSTQIANSFKRKIDSSISSSASRMKTEFQVALNSLTYTPKINTTQASAGASLVKTHIDTKNPSFLFLQQSKNQLNNLEKDFEQKMTSLEKKRSNVQVFRGIERQSDKSFSQYDKVAEEKVKLEAELKGLSSSIQKNKESIRAAEEEFKIASKEYNQEKRNEARAKKQELLNEQSYLNDKKLLLEEEIGYKTEEMRLYGSIVRELDLLLGKIKDERLSIIKKGVGTVPKDPTLVTTPGRYPGIQNIPMNYTPPLEYDPRQNYGFRSYGYSSGAAYSGVAMPGNVGVFNWNNIPKEYRPNIYGGAYTPHVFGFNTQHGGDEMLRGLRQQEIAMTKEMQKTLGITDKELIKFYEELIQVNAALAKTTTIQNSKTTTHNGMAAEQALMMRYDPTDTFVKTKGNMIPIYTEDGVKPTYRQTYGLNALFGKNSAVDQALFEAQYKNWYKDSIAYKNQMESNFKQYSRYNLPSGTMNTREENLKAQRVNEISNASNPASAAVLYNQMKTEEEILKNKEKQAEQIKKSADDTLKKRQQSNSWWGRRKNQLSSLSGGTKGLKGFGSALSKVTNFMGGGFFAAMMAFDIGMQIYNHYHDEYLKKIQEATQAIDEATQKVSEAENVFFQGRHEEGLPEIKGWDEEHPDATAEERQDALLSAYSDIYDTSTKGLGSLDRNTQELAIATAELKRTNEALVRDYMEDPNWGPNGRITKLFDPAYTPEDRDSLEEFFGEGTGHDISGLVNNLDSYLGGLLGEKSTSSVDKYGDLTQYHGGSILDTGEAQLGKWQESEEYPWLKEFAPLLAADVWKTGSSKDGLKIVLGESGQADLMDQLSSTTGWDASAWNKHGYNIADAFGTNAEQNKLQMGLKNYSKDFTNLAKQMRRFEKATGATPMKALKNQLGKTDMKKALKNLSVQDPKLVSYIKSLAIKTGMSEQQVLMAAQLQQLQDMQDIANNQITPRMESVVGLAYQQIAYSGQTLGEVGSSGSGAVSAAQNAAAIAALLNAKMENELDEQGYKQWVKDHPDQEDPYGDAIHFAAARDASRKDGKSDEMDKYYVDYVKSYAATNAMMYNPNLSPEQAKKMAEEWWTGVSPEVSAAAIHDTLRKGGVGALQRATLSAYDAGLNEQEGTGSGSGGSGSGKDSDKDNTGTRKERVDLVLCNKKEIPKLNVNLFKKPPSFTILNKNFKLRDVKINSEDKPKAIMAAIKNSFIDIQKRSDPKIVQDEEAIYDPAGATDGKDLPSGSAKTKTNK